MKVRVAGIIPESYVDGTGLRYALFMQGCRRRCAGCHNPRAQKIDGGWLFDTADIVAMIKRNPLIEGVTLTGGEPFLQMAAANEIAEAAKKLSLNVWCYTGYRYEELPSGSAEFLKNVDVLVDGEYIESQRDLGLRFRGSRNQRIIDVQKTLQEKKIVLWE